MTSANNGVNGLPIITSPITINGNGAVVERDSSAPDFRLFEIGAAGSLTVSEATVTGASLTTSTSTTFAYGGAFYVNGGSLTVVDSTISGNTISAPESGRGAAIMTVGGGDATVRNSTISGNDVTGALIGSGAGVAFAYSSTVTIENSTISGNSTMSNGSVYGGGAGVYSYNGGAATVRSSTITGNSSVTAAGSEGGGLYTFNAGTITIQDTIISGNSGGITDCSVVNSTVAATFSLIGVDGGAAQCGGITVDGLNLDPNLQDNGGSTSTHALLGGSQALELVPGSQLTCDPGVSMDQRGRVRGDGSTSGLACDAGAYEFENLSQTFLPIISNPE